MSKIWYYECNQVTFDNLKEQYPSDPKGPVSFLGNIVPFGGIEIRVANGLVDGEFKPVYRNFWKL